jgi:hypothetical protein
MNSPQGGGQKMDSHELLRERKATIQENLKII